jgi:hypothetical protein
VKYVLLLNFNIIVIIVVNIVIVLYPVLRRREIWYEAANVSGMAIDEAVSTYTSVTTHKDKQNRILQE